MTSLIEERLAGAVWGHLVGDALGVPYEFRAPGTIAEVRWGVAGTHGQPAGTWSDDGGLMLALLDSLLEAGFDMEDQGRRALAWHETDAYKAGPLFDIGITTSRALSRLRNGIPALEAGGRDERDNGNGSLMRILPIALVDPRLSIRTVAEQAASASRLTHAHPRAEVACAVYCAAARRLLEEPAGVDSALSAALDDARLTGSSEHLVELDNLIGYGLRSGSGYVLDTFWSAWSAFASSSSYRETVEKAIRLGHDTDTTACIAGGLAGLRWGIESIPIEWLSGMRGREIAQPLVDRLVERWKTAARC